MQRVFRETVPWDTHATEISRLQDRIKNLRNLYNALKCRADPNANLNDSDVDRVTRRNFNPNGTEWRKPPP